MDASKHSQLTTFCEDLGEIFECNYEYLGYSLFILARGILCCALVKVRLPEAGTKKEKEKI